MNYQNDSSAEITSPTLKLMLSILISPTEPNGDRCPPRLGYRPDECATIIGCGRSTVYKDMASLLLSAKKLGDTTILPLWDIIDYMLRLPDWRPQTVKSSVKNAHLI